MRLIKSSIIYSMTNYVMALILCGFFALPGVSYAGESNPSQKVNMGGGSGNSSGAGSAMPDLFTGTMSYSIPIEVPEGRHGMSPGLSLDYRSNNGNGWVGVGWELEVGALERSMKSGMSYTGNDYILRIAGGTMDLVQTSTNEYRAKVEGSFYRIKKQNGSNGDYWEVTDKAGVRYFYGQTVASRQDDPADASRIFKWCLDRVEDPNGNFMTVTYTKTPFNTLYADYGQIYLDRIDYTGNTSGLPTNNWVKFYLEARTDAPDMYSTKFKVKTAYRLKTIDVWNGASGRIRTYALEYDTDPNTAGAQNSASTGRSLLTKVQQFGKDADVDSASGVVTGVSALPARTFSWQDSEASSGTFPASYNWTSAAGKGTGYTVQPGDFNGDGMTDIYMFNASTGHSIIWLNNGDGKFPDDYTWEFDSGLGTGYVAQLGDFDGDGKTDIYMFNASTGSHVVWINNANGTFTKHSLGSGYGIGYAVSPGDFNGDSIADIYMFNSSTGDHIVWLNNGNGTFPKTPTDSPSYKWQSGGGRGTGYAVQLGDFNGDGKSDIYMFNASTGDHIVWLNNGDGSFPSTYAWQSGGGFGIGYTVQLGDFNGDGKIDIYLFAFYASTPYKSVNTDHIVWINNGDGTFPASYNWRGANYIPGDVCVAPPYCQDVRANATRVQVADFNSDGKADIFLYNYVSNTNAVWLNNGDGTFSANFKWASGSGHGTGGTNFPLLGDFNGDGKTDILVSNTSTGTHNVWLNQGLYPDLLASINNGLGGTTVISYVPSTQYVNTLLPFPVNTVSTITTYDGNNLVSSSTYTYSGGYYHIGDRDFRGFNYVKVTGPGSSGERVISETWFHQGNDTAFDVNVPTASGGYMKGKPYRTIVSDGQGQKYRETTINYHDNLSSFATNSFNPPHQVDNYVCDGGVCGIHTKTIYEEYDDYGNVEIEQFYADANASPYRKVIRSFTSVEASWLVGLPLTEDVYDGSGTHHMAGSNYYYDDVPSNETGCNTASSNTTPSKGNITRIVRWFNDPSETGMPNPEVRMAYDEYGNLVCTHDPNGNPSTVSYDSTSTFPLISRNALQQESKTRYYGVDNEPADKGLYGQVKSVTALHLSADLTPPATIIEYDAFGRKTKVNAPDGTWASWSYSDFGVIGSQHVMIVNSAGLTARAYFDGLGRTYLKKQDGPDGKTITAKTEYNITGTVKQASMPYFDGTETPRYTTYTYDPMGRVTLISSPSGTVLGCYNGAVTVGIDADGHRKQETRDALGRLVKVEEYMGITYTSCPTDAIAPYATTSYEYDILGNLVKVTDAATNKTEMKYDSLGRKYDMKDPDMGHWTYQYYANGNLWKQIDANGHTITFTYDALNRVKIKDYPTGTGVGYTYDEPTSTYPVGRLTKMTDASGTTTYNYDIMGRSSSGKKNIDGIDYTIMAGYDNGRLASITYPDGETISYNYGTGNTLTAVRNAAANYIYAYYQNYNALGQPGSVTNGNGVGTTYQYYPQNSRLQNITTTGPAQQLLNLSYEYSDGGNVKSITDNLNPNISSMAAPGQAITYAYEGTRPHAVTSTNDGITYEYDKNTNGNGNMTFDGVRRIDYDYDNMPQSVLSSLGTTTFVYDGAGARVKKTGPYGETVYIGKLYECRNGTCVKYIYGGGARIALKTGGDTIYYHQDHLGSSRVITGDTGENLEQVYYDPFGATSADGGAMTVSHKYTSQEFDAETGLYYYNARYYNPALGRFISPDTIVPDPRNSQAYNRYSYVLNNPMIYTDPSGHSFWKRAHNWAKKPWHAVLIQSIDKGMGTYLLSQTKRGRQILVEEVAAAAIVGSSGVFATEGEPLLLADSGQISLEAHAYRTASIAIPDWLLNLLATAGTTYIASESGGSGTSGGGSGGGTPPGNGGGGGGTPPGNDGGGGDSGGGGSSSGGGGNTRGLMGSSYGGYAAQYWANMYNNQSNAWYADIAYWVMGHAASLWTPETSMTTFDVLTVAYGNNIGIKGGYELKIGKDFRLAPWGNRTGHPNGELPHYHRRIRGPNDDVVPGGSIDWHRPWEQGW